MSFAEDLRCSDPTSQTTVAIVDGGLLGLTYWTWGTSSRYKYEAFHGRNSLVVAHEGKFFITTMTPVFGDTRSEDPG